MDRSKHVVLAFTTEWCEHCKEVDKAFNDIKKEIKSDEIVFAKVDYDKNDLDVLIR